MAASSLYELGKFRFVISRGPTIEIYCLLIVVVQDLREDFLVLSIAEACFALLMARSIRKRLKVCIVLVLPAYAESFHASAAAFRKACVAKLAIMHDHLAPCLVYHPADCGSRGSCQPLISLAVVVGAYVE